MSEAAGPSNRSSSSMTASSSSVPLLVPGWTEHMSPKGKPYYHNAATGISTYKRPCVQKPKREKPVSKTLVPHAEGWLRVLTNKGNTFYFHPETKRSEWTAPSEIMDAVEQMQTAEAQEEVERQQALEREEKQARERQWIEKMERKRKAEECVPITEFGSETLEDNKKLRLDDIESDEEDQQDEHEEHTDLEAEKAEEPPETRNKKLATTDNDEQGEDEEWQRQIAEEMAAEANAQDTELVTTEEPIVQDLESLKAAFHADLTALNGTATEVNPMAPWDLELPKFNHVSSFSSLPAKEREESFNQWCKLRIREKRTAKAASGSVTAAAASKTTSPEESYRGLLNDEVRSTRTKWDDFRSVFKRDARFRHFSSDKEREKLFNDHLRQLGEEKRIAAERAQEAFLELLSEKLPGNLRNKVAAAKASSTEKEAIASVWLEAKQTNGLIQDERYDQVGSSTRRLELFQVWARGEKRVQSIDKSAPVETQVPKKDEAGDKARSKYEATQKALRERQDKVRQEQERVMRQNRAALSQATRQESVVTFQQLLVDSVRDAEMDKRTAMRHMARDPRFDAPGLGDVERDRLLEDYMTRLKDKQQVKLEKVFGRHAQDLDAHPDDVVALTMQDDELETGALRHYLTDQAAVEKQYHRWNQERHQQAEQDFMQMLQESAFVDFWGRFKNSASLPDSKTQADDSDDQDGGTLLDMAAKVDLDEIQFILRNDARFRAFQHKPQQREAWIRQHLSSLAAPPKSFHR